jgi:hypothetical protein
MRLNRVPHTKLEKIEIDGWVGQYIKLLDYCEFKFSTNGQNMTTLILTNMHTINILRTLGLQHSSSAVQRY